MTLEWETTSPPPTENFAETPVLTHGPYDYDTVSVGKYGRRRGENLNHAEAIRRIWRIISATSEQQQESAKLGMWLFS